MRAKVCTKLDRMEEKTSGGPGQELGGLTFQVHVTDLCTSLTHTSSHTTTSCVCPLCLIGQDDGL